MIDVDSKSRTASFVDEYGADIGTFYIGDPNFWNTNPKKFKDYKFAVKLKYFNGTTNMIKGIR